METTTKRLKKSASGAHLEGGKKGNKRPPYRETPGVKRERKWLLRNIVRRRLRVYEKESSQMSRDTAKEKRLNRKHDQGLDKRQHKEGH